MSPVCCSVSVPFQPTIFVWNEPRWTKGSMYRGWSNPMVMMNSSLGYLGPATLLCPACQRVADDLLGLGHYGIQVRLVLEALRVDFIDILSAGRPGGKPAAGRDHLQAADRGVVAGSSRQLRG